MFLNAAQDINAAQDRSVDRLIRECAAAGCGDEAAQ